MAKQRRSYPREEYLEKREALYKLVQKAKHVRLNEEEHNITGESLAPIIYIDGSEAPLFDELNRKHFDCREIKIINPDKPAIALHFTTRHKYQIERNPKPAKVQAYLDKLIEDVEDYLITYPDHEEAKKRLSFLKKIYRNPDAFNIAISNYFRYYRYPYVNYRYADGKGYNSVNTHLIASYMVDEDDDQEEYDKFPRHNVIFVDSVAIARPQPANDHARTANYLNEFKHRFDVGKRDIFING